MLTLLLLLAVSNFGAGISLLLYFTIYLYFIKKKINIKIFLFFPILLSFIFLILFRYGNLSILNSETIRLDIFNINLLKAIKNYLGLSASVYFPYLIFLKPIYILIGLIQNLIILYYIFLNKKKYLDEIKNLVVRNPFLIIGILGCSIISIFRGDAFEQIRYFSFSIFFQLGFFIFIHHQNSKIFLIVKKKLFLFLIAVLYLISIVGPNTGLHFAISRTSIANMINNCLILHYKDCNKIIYDLTFHKKNWYNYSDFESHINYLKKNKLSFFST
jgi:hypothetical protein